MYMCVCLSREVTPAGALVWKARVLAVPSGLRFRFSGVCLPRSIGKGTFSKDLFAAWFERHQNILPGQPIIWKCSLQK